jgi:hypothetical protein
VKGIGQGWWTRSLRVKEFRVGLLSGRCVGRAQFRLRSTGREPGGFEERLSELRRRAGVRGAVRFQMVQDFSNDAESAATITFQGIG